MPPRRPRSDVTRRQLGIAGVGGFALGAALSPGGRLARAAGPERPAGPVRVRPITIAGFGDTFQTAFDGVVLAAFRKTHPDIPVFYYPVGNSFQALGLLRDQRGLPTVDVALLEAGVAERAMAEKLVEPLTPEQMPVLKDLIPLATMPNPAGPALMLDSLALCYAPPQFTTAPRTWRKLWDASLGRQIAMPVPPDPIALAMTVVATNLFGGGSPAQSLDSAMTALAELAPRVMLWDPRPDIYTAVAFGDAGLGPGWNARAQQQAALTPGRFGALIPEEGSPILATTVNLVKDSRQSEAARMLIAWLLAPEAQRLIASSMFYAPVNAGVTDLPAAVQARAGATPLMATRRMPVDWGLVTSVRGRITGAWRQRNLGG